MVDAAKSSASARGVPVSVDPASAGFLGHLGADRFLALAAGVDILLPSEDEARQLTGWPDAEDAAAQLSRAFPLVVVKRGAKGALVARDGAVRARVPAFPVARTEDTTGAGDAFTGAFLAGLLRGSGITDAVAEGCRAGARAVSQVGARPARGTGGTQGVDGMERVQRPDVTRRPHGTHRTDGSRGTDGTDGGPC